MVRKARQRHPDLQFTVGSIDALDVADGSLAGVLAWYSVVHTPPGELGTVIGELIRVLAPGGCLLLAFLSGDGALHLTRSHGCLSPLYVAQFRHAIWHPWERSLAARKPATRR